MNRIKKPKSRLSPEREASLNELVRFSKEEMEKHGPQHWILNESGEVIPASLLEWALWFEKHRSIQQDYIDDHLVSTIFEGLDIRPSFVPNRRPRLFETMVFGPPKPSNWFDGTERMMRPNLWRERDCTLQEALATHAKAIEWLKSYLNDKAAKS